jgi:tetratricopeptide (TPR) repeat protein
MTRRPAPTVAPLAALALSLAAALVLPAGAPGGAGRCAAQEADAPAPPPEALELYQRGRALYAEGRYREAAVELERAQVLDPTSPNLVFNVARVYELLGDLEKSIGFYQRYLRLLPPSETAERDRIEATLRRLEGARDEVRRPTEAPAQPPSAAPLRDPQPVRVQERGVADALFWGTASAGAALLIGGTVTGLLALDTERATGDYVVGLDGTFADRQVLADRADTLALVADVLFIAGGVTAAASALLFALRERTVERYPGLEGSVRADLTVLPGGGLVTLRGAL